MTRQQCLCSRPLPHRQPQSPDPLSIHPPHPWRSLDPQRQQRLAAHLAGLIRRHYSATQQPKEMDHEQRPRERTRDDGASG
jgi:hypothetical protein